MATRNASPATIDEYVAGFPSAVRAILTRARRAIRSAAPEAQEIISLDQAIPYSLIKRIVRLRVKQDLARAAARRGRDSRR